MQVSGKTAGRRERKKKEIYRRIGRAAAELFQENGYEATTVEAIAERADVAKGTVFNYFPRKESLLTALSSDMVEQLQFQLGMPETWTGTSREKLVHLFLKMAELAEENRELSKIVLFENMRNLWLSSQADPAMLNLQDTIRAVLADGQRRGEFREKIDVEIAARLMESAYFTTLVLWLSEGTAGAVFRKELADKFDIIFRGLGAIEMWN